jgi:hypothetical protein
MKTITLMGRLLLASLALLSFSGFSQTCTTTKTWHTRVTGPTTVENLTDLPMSTWYEPSSDQIRGGICTMTFENKGQGSLQIWVGGASTKYTLSPRSSQVLTFTINECSVNPIINYHLFIENSNDKCPVWWTYYNTSWTNGHTRYEWQFGADYGVGSGIDRPCK